jgi:UDP:flavonoid glycosyltransferase YjiC (YdhE family)
MSKFLFTVWPLRTHLNPFMSVAHALRERGHEVVFYTGPSILELVREQGFRCFPFQAVDDALVERAVRGLASSQNWRPGRWRGLMLDTVPDQLRDLEEIWKTWRPDALVCDVAMWGPMLVFHELKSVPVVPLSHVATCLLPGAENPLPGAKWLLKGLPLRPLAPAIAWIWRQASSAVPRAANKLRATWGLPLLTGTVTEFTGTLPLYLIPGTPAFDGNRRDLPPSVQYVGPCLWDKDAKQAPPDWIATVPRDQPRVVVSEGTIYPEEPRLLQIAARGLANLPMKVILIAGEGRKLESLKLGPLAPNVRIENWTPLSDVLPIADVLVAGGDSETVMTSLNRKLPMVLVPMILDQPEISWVVATFGAGLRIPRGKGSPERLAFAVTRVLAEPQFRENAARLADDFVEYSGGDRAARLLENLVSG